MAKKTISKPKQFNYELSKEQIKAMPTPVLLNWFHIAQIEIKQLEEGSKLRKKLTESMKYAEEEYTLRR